MNGLLLWIKNHRISSALITIVVVFQFLNFSGFCYSETRWPNKLELVDRALFRDKAQMMSIEEKEKFVKDRYASKYPENCKINEIPSDLTGWEILLNTIFGRKLYEVGCLSLKSGLSKGDEKEEAYWEFNTIDSCATQVVDTSGMSITKKLYQSQLKRNQTYWQENSK